VCERGNRGRLETGVQPAMSESAVVIVRSVVTFLSLLVFCRLLGKTQVAQLTFFEYVTGITIGSIAGELTTDLGVRPWPMFAGLAAWAGLTLATQYAALKSRWVSKMLDGEPVIVVQNGQVLEANLRATRLRLDDLLTLLRTKGVFTLREVEFALLEPTGELSVLKRSQYLPATPSDLQIPTDYQGLSIELVVDGQVQEQNLSRLGLNADWLRQQLLEQKHVRLEETFFVSLDTSGHLYVDTCRDRIPPENDISDYPGPN
jgi:uncharacterized membrane protein YcaP (DUF421 family)